jgi:hypothetical protein
MKRTIVLFLLLLSTVACASAFDFYNGKDLNDQWNDAKQAYQGKGDEATGFYAGVMMGYIAGVAGALDGSAFRLPRSVTTVQLAAIVGNYLEKNPDKRNWGARNLVVAALSEAFPKPSGE